MEIKNKRSASIDDIEIGSSESIIKVISHADVKLFAELSGDFNPIHLDEEYAKNSRYKKNIAHGLMCASFFSGIFGTKLPGLGAIYTSQTLNFKRPIYIGDAVEVFVEVTNIDKNKRRVQFITQCKVKSKTCIEGNAEIYIP